MILKTKTLSENIYRSLKGEIIKGKYPPEYPIPTEMELADKYEVARGTVRKALKKLEDEDFITKIRSRGTFVKDSPGQKRQKIAVVKFADCPIFAPQNYILPGIEKAATEAGVELEYYDIKFILRMNDPEGLKKALKRQGVTGIICIGSGFVENDPFPKLIKQTGLPVVLPHIRYRRDYLSTGFAAIRYEEKKAFSAALKHLMEKGHSRIATLALVDGKGLMRGYLPEEYKAYLKMMKLDADERLLKIIDYDEEKIGNAVTELMSMTAPPSAILCYSDFWAYFVYETLKKLSLKTPDDVAVMGFCGFPERNLFNPSLSTVDLMYEEHGKEAFKLIMNSDKWYENDKDAPEIVMPYKLMEEESTRPERVALTERR